MTSMTKEELKREKIEQDARGDKYLEEMTEEEIKELEELDRLEGEQK